MPMVITRSAFLLLCCLSFCQSIIASEPNEPTSAPQVKKTQIIILGTIHSSHHKNPNYSCDKLKEIIISMKPDIILNELPLSLVDSNDRPIEQLRDKQTSPECWAADTAATELGIKQLPYDRPDRQENFKKTNFSEKQNKSNELLNRLRDILEKEDANAVDVKILQLWDNATSAEAALFQSAGPEIINSEAHDSVTRIKHSMWYEIAPEIIKKYPGLEELTELCRFFREQWTQRNRVMADNILNAAKKFPGKRLLVLTGATHRYILRDLLKNEGTIELKEFWETKNSQ